MFALFMRPDLRFYCLRIAGIKVVLVSCCKGNDLGREICRYMIE